MIPSQDPDYGDLGPACPPWPGSGRDAILQPPKPEITPSPQVLQRAADREAAWEARRLTAARRMIAPGRTSSSSWAFCSNQKRSLLARRL